MCLLIDAHERTSCTDLPPVAAPPQTLSPAPRSDPQAPGSRGGLPRLGLSDHLTARLDPVPGYCCVRIAVD